ncbi:hypothetical protein [Evansella cellulosilytica]|uniref:Uncharacterized protein n=1 Tax=Evansella cellulosilytica (strain ATCC 21833 / DSM 2522 / FERM P-1141 / JCM 9156 / N-4) TaxID=649639 RepID=E6TWE3_EVAC2|nr:hypothetical protein [Evansella cellulosilytica]ADU32206.1 hypothetical protein Bcell_3973 [Evansella cellulosilytica DSM 2522]
MDEQSQIHNIIDNRGEEHELMLIITTISSIMTFKRIKKLEQYRKKLKGSFKPY